MLMNNKPIIVPEEIIDKILSFDPWASVDIIIAFGLEIRYITKYSNIINNDEKSQYTQFMCNWRLQSLVNANLYKLDQTLLDNLPKSIWKFISMKSVLRNSFIIKNAHNLNLAMVKYFKKGEISHKLLAALPDFEKMNKCTECFEDDAISGPHYKVNCKTAQYLCALCSENLCLRCKHVEIPLEYDEHGCCAGCAGCSEYDYFYF